MNPSDSLLRAANFNVGFTTGKYRQFQAGHGVSFDIPANSTDLRLAARPVAPEDALSPTDRSSL